MEKRKVAIFGAGIAGLTAAHELVRQGCEVSVYEMKSSIGGFFRSYRRENGLPTEYSWHGFGPWYNNTFDLMKSIPFDSSSSVYEKALSRPIDFGIFPKNGKASFFRALKDIKPMFQLTWLELLRSSWIMLKSWLANRRSQEVYSQIRAVDAWKNVLSPRSLQNWKASFGPWIGSDWSRVSYHTAGEFFRKQLTSPTVHLHSGGADGSPWQHGKLDGWLLLKGPSSEYWFEKWLTHLKQQGVIFKFNSSLKQFKADDTGVKEAWIEDDDGEQQKILADDYLLAVNPYFAKDVLFNSPGMEKSQELLQLYGLTQARGHVQVSFRLAFGEPIKFPRKRMAMVLAETEYNLTLFAQEQAWTGEAELGEGVFSLWTGTTCIETKPGKVSGRPVLTCEKNDFLKEIKEQIFNCASLNQEIEKANNGRKLEDFKLIEIEVWPEWSFSSKGIKTPWPKWVNDSQNQRFLPVQKSSIPNLVFAGAHTRTQADVWSIEAAVESGRLAAQAIAPQVQVIKQRVPQWIKAGRLLDDLCYKKGWPHILDLFLTILLMALIVAIFE